MVGLNRLLRLFDASVCPLYDKMINAQGEFVIVTNLVLRVTYILLLDRERGHSNIC